MAAVVLAAGASSRMGRPKQLLPFGCSTLLGTVVDTLLASRVDSVTVVLGYHVDEVREAVGGRPVQIVVNPDPSRGMLSSVQCGIAAVEADAYLIALGDQPQLRPEVVDVLIEAAERSPRSIFLPTYAGKRGHPLLLHASHRAEILALPLSVGLNTLIARHADEVEEVEVHEPEVLEDVDTPEEYEGLAHRSKGSC